MRALSHHSLLHLPLPSSGLFQRAYPAHFQSTHLSNPVRHLQSLLFHIIIAVAKWENAAKLRHLLV